MGQIDTVHPAKLQYWNGCVLCTAVCESNFSLTNDYPNIFMRRKKSWMTVRIYLLWKNPQIFRWMNIVINKYSNIFQYPNIRYTLHWCAALKFSLCAALNIVLCAVLIFVVCAALNVLLCAVLNVVLCAVLIIVLCAALNIVLPVVLKVVLCAVLNIVLCAALNFFCVCCNKCCVVCCTNHSPVVRQQPSIMSGLWLLYCCTALAAIQLYFCGCCGCCTAVMLYCCSCFTAVAAVLLYFCTVVML